MIEQIVFRYWWVCGFGVLCYLVFVYASQTLDDQMIELQGQKAALIASKEQELAKNEDLQLQINSQSDPAWVELTLMKGLGLVPEEQTKIYFSQ